MAGAGDYEQLLVVAFEFGESVLAEVEGMGLVACTIRTGRSSSSAYSKNLKLRKGRLDVAFQPPLELSERL